jgi:hypothetical protein
VPADWRTRFAPIRPSPIIPSCIGVSAGMAGQSSIVLSAPSAGIERTCSRWTLLMFTAGLVS